MSNEKSAVELFDKYILDVLYEIGFRELYEHTETEVGYSVEYKYYPDYLSPRHYTLLTFTRWSDKDSIDYRMYIHNENGSFSESPFQLSSFDSWNRNYISNKINDMFVRELRDSRINDLLNE